MFCRRRVRRRYDTVLGIMTAVSRRRDVVGTTRFLYYLFNCVLPSMILEALPTTVQSGAWARRLLLFHASPTARRRRYFISVVASSGRRRYISDGETLASYGCETVSPTARFCFRNWPLKGSIQRNVDLTVARMQYSVTLPETIFAETSKPPLAKYRSKEPVKSSGTQGKMRMIPSWH